MAQPLQTYEIDCLYVGITNIPTCKTMYLMSQNLDRNLHDVWQHHKFYPDSRICLRSLHSYSTPEPHGDVVRFHDDLQFIVFPLDCFENYNTCAIRCAFFQDPLYGAHATSEPFKLTPKRVYRKIKEEKEYINETER